MKEGGFGAPDGKERKELHVSRRKVLGGILGLAAVGAVGESVLRIPDFTTWSSDRAKRMRFDRWHTLSPREREAAIVQEITQAGHFVRGREGRRILESGNDNELFSLIYSMPPILGEHITDTRYDVPRNDWPSAAVCFDAKDGRPFVLNLSSDPETISRNYSGNGVFVEADTLLTNFHVVYPLANPRLVPEFSSPTSSPMAALQQKYLRTGIDAVYIRFDEEVTLGDRKGHSSVFALDPTLSDGDVSGSFITAAGIDPDPSRVAEADGSKLYPSVALPVTARLRRFLREYATDKGLDDSSFKSLEGGFMLIAPPGETTLRPSVSLSGFRLIDKLTGNTPSIPDEYGAGMSGSPVLMNGALAGLLYGGFEVAYGGIALDVCFFHGPSALREAVAKGMIINASDISTSAAQGAGSYYQDYGG